MWCIQCHLSLCYPISNMNFPPFFGSNSKTPPPSPSLTGLTAHNKQSITGSKTRQMHRNSAPTNSRHQSPTDRVPSLWQFPLFPKALGRTTAIIGKTCKPPTTETMAQKGCAVVHQTRPEEITTITPEKQRQCTGKCSGNANESAERKEGASTNLRVGEKT